MPVVEYSGLVYQRRKEDVRRKLKKEGVHRINLLSIKFPTKKKGKRGWKFVARVMEQPRRKKRKKKRK